MHLILDGTVLSALFVLAITIWACGGYATAPGPFAWPKAMLGAISAFAIVLALVITVLALFHR